MSLEQFLNEIQSDLRGLCHDVACKRHNGHPLFHKLCRGQFDLESSVYWEAADVIRRFLEATEVEGKIILMPAMASLINILSRKDLPEVELLTRAMAAMELIIE